MIYSKQIGMSVLGSICRNLDLARDRSYDLSINDFDDIFHKQIFAAIQNLALERDIDEVDGIGIAVYLQPYNVQFERFKSFNGVEFVDSIRELSKNTSFENNYKMLKKLSLLRRFEEVGMDVKEIYDHESLDVNLIDSQLKSIEKKSIDEIKQFFKNKLIEIDLEFQTNTDSYSFEAGSGIEDLIDRCKSGILWGPAFQSKFFNTIFGGMQKSKLMIRSAGTGGSKTRQAIGDMCNLSCSERYDPKVKKWIRKEDTENSLLISTELTKDEIHLAVLSTVSGVREEKIKYGQTDVLEDERIKKAVNIIKSSKMFFEFTSNFSLTELENIIERNIIRNDTSYVFFDYIQLTPNLASELNNLFGYTLREDQALSQTSNLLKNIAVKHDVFLCTSTQLNRNYKTDVLPDATWLRGGKQIA